MARNILLIICDQLSAGALRFGGSAYGSAEAMERLASEGTRLESCYCNAPLCQPSRASFWTSRYPHETGVTSNLREFPFPAVPETLSALGECFVRAGYRAIHFGKEHDYGSLRGFERVPSSEIEIPREDPAINLAYETFLDIDTTAKVCRFLGSDRAKERPFLTVADLQNPHNICFYIGENKDGCRDFAGNPELPPLPANFETDDLANRPPFIQYLCCAHRRLRQASRWTAGDYRHYLYAYHHYISRVDRQIGEILGALADAGLAEETLVVLMADHGEGMAAHRLVTKYGNFYEESARVPFVFRGPGIPRGRALSGLASLLDLKPTLLGFAGLPAVPEDRGTNLMPVLTDPDAARSPVPYVVSAWEDEFSGYTVPGRMYRFGRYKYMAYRDFAGPDTDEVRLWEELYDLEADPGETRTLAGDRDYERIKEEALEGLKRHCRLTGDPFFTSLPSYDRTLYRRHALGYCHHEGLSAVEIHVSQREKK